MAMKLRITSVDHYGLCGRDYHPKDDMIGHTALVHKVDVHHSETFETVTHATPEDLSIFYAVLDDGRQVVLAEHEVEFVEFT